jgi:membrane associated rhomboid family serine protease
MNVNEVEFESAPPATARPKTTTVVGLLIAVAGILSYLLSYATANALVAAEVVKPWTKETDPRPRWFAIGFVILISLFGAIAALIRHSSAAHLRQIEEMEKEGD